MEVKITESDYKYLKILKKFNKVLVKEHNEMDSTLSYDILYNLSPGAVEVVRSVFHLRDHPEDGTVSVPAITALLKDTVNTLEKRQDGLGFMYYAADISDNRVPLLPIVAQLLQTEASRLVTALGPITKNMDLDINATKAKIKKSLKKYWVEAKVNVSPEESKTQWIRLYNAAAPVLENHRDINWITPITSEKGE